MNNNSEARWPTEVVATGDARVDAIVESARRMPQMSSAERLEFFEAATQRLRSELDAPVGPAPATDRRTPNQVAPDQTAHHQAGHHQTAPAQRESAQRETERDS